VDRLAMAMGDMFCDYLERLGNLRTSA
jgi:hypothetical protein